MALAPENEVIFGAQDKLLERELCQWDYYDLCIVSYAQSSDEGLGPEDGSNILNWPEGITPPLVKKRIKKMRTDQKSLPKTRLRRARYESSSSDTEYEGVVEGARRRIAERQQPALQQPHQRPVPHQPPQLPVQQPPQQPTDDDTSSSSLSWKTCNDDVPPTSPIMTDVDPQPWYSLVMGWLADQ